MTRRTWPVFVACLLAVMLPGMAWAQDRANDSSPSSSRSRVDVTPYIEAAQVLTAELSPGDDVLTYSRVAAGVDATISGKNNAASVSLRYERMIGWGDDRAPDGDVLSGLARASTAIVPQTLFLEAGAMATRTHVDGNGASSIGPFSRGDQSTQIYSAYAGPSLSTDVGPANVSAHYRIGYNRVELDDAVVFTNPSDPVDVFDESVTHVAEVSAGIAPHELLPVGISGSVGWTEENISNLDQRVRDRHANVNLTWPVSPTVALVAGLGYEDVEVSMRDAVRDASGAPVVGPDGRYVTDDNSPRIIAYDAEGLIWDVGVVWRPSRRTQLEAHVGRRYDSTTYYGSFGWRPDSRSSVNVSVYDGISGFGGRLGTMLSGLSTDFTAIRNPLTGDLTGCVQSLDGADCLGGALGSVRSAVFRSRGVTASYSLDMGRTSAGIGAGYDHRKFLAAPGTVLAAANGEIDESFWMSAYVSRSLDSRSSLSANVYTNYFRTDRDRDADVYGYGASLAFYRELAARLTGSAVVSLDGLDLDGAEDLLGLSALAGLRYSF